MLTKAQSVMRLRELTGLGVMQCKLIIAEAGSLDAAMEMVQSHQPLPTYVSYSGFCPACGAGLRFPNQMECPSCDWLRVPPNDRSRWGNAGRCPTCGFAYRWDGNICGSSRTLVGGLRKHTAVRYDGGHEPIKGTLSVVAGSG